MDAEENIDDVEEFDAEDVNDSDGAGSPRSKTSEGSGGGGTRRASDEEGGEEEEEEAPAEVVENTYQLEPEPYER